MDKVDAASIINKFRMFDRNKNGKIELSELKMVLQVLDRAWTQDRLLRLFRVLDINSDDSIDYKEFVSWVFFHTAVRTKDIDAFRGAVGVDMSPSIESKLQRGDEALRRHDKEVEHVAEELAKAQARKDQRGVEMKQVAEIAERHRLAEEAQAERRRAEEHEKQEATKNAAERQKDEDGRKQEVLEEEQPKQEEEIKRETEESVAVVAATSTPAEEAQALWRHAEEQEKQEAAKNAAKRQKEEDGRRQAFLEEVAVVAATSTLAAKKHQSDRSAADLLLDKIDKHSHLAGLEYPLSELCDAGACGKPPDTCMETYERILEDVMEQRRVVLPFDEVVAAFEEERQRELHDPCVSIDKETAETAEVSELLNRRKQLTEQIQGCREHLLQIVETNTMPIREFAVYRAGNQSYWVSGNETRREHWIQRGSGSFLIEAIMGTTSRAKMYRGLQEDLALVDTEIAQAVQKDIVLSLRGEKTADGTLILTCASMGGEVLATLHFETLTKATLADVRKQLTNQITAAGRHRIILENGTELSDASGDKSIADLLGI